MPHYAMSSNHAPRDHARFSTGDLAQVPAFGRPTATSPLGRLADEPALEGWDQGPALGIPVLDRQHRRLIRLCEALREAVAGHDESALGDLIERLGALTQEHFATEEKLMEIGYYPFLEEHRRSHRRLTERLLGFQRRHLEGAAIGHELLRELRLFLTTHIRHEDPLFVPYVLSIPNRSWLARLCDALFPVRPAEL
jgi:hemerythrin